MKNEKYRNRIIFFYPSYQLGGVQTLFVRIILSLVKRYRPVGYIDFSTGYLRTALVNVEQAEYIDIKSVILEDDDVIVTSFNFINIINLFIPHNTKVLFWFLHPSNLPAKLLGKKVGIDFSKDTTILKHYRGWNNFKITAENRAVYFMDRECYLQNGSPSLDYDYFLPLYIDKDLSKNRQYNHHSSTIRIAWIGRIDLSSKYFALCFLIRQFAMLKNSEKHKESELLIIGNGRGIYKIEKLIKKLGLEQHISLHNNIKYEDFHQYISTNIDIAFAHGTSCLESASVGIPTVVIDVSYKELPDSYKLSWLFEREKFDVGRVISGQESNKTGHNFEQILDQLVTDRLNISIKSKLAVTECYTEDSFSNQFDNAINNVIASNEAINKSNIFTYLIDFIVLHKFIFNFLYYKSINH